MLFITEAPLHFGLLVLSCIVLLLMLLIGILAVLKSETPSATRFSGFLSVFFAFFAFLILAISINQVPALATNDQLLPYYLGAWSCVALHGFFLVFYMVGFKWLKERKWAVYLPIIGTISFLAILWIFATPSTTVVISDGIINWLIMPLVVYAYGGFLAIFYMFLVPLIIVLRLNKTREGAVKMWNWIGWFGLFLWFIAAILMALVQYVAPFMLIALGLAAIAWIIVFISWIFLERAT